MPKIMKGIERHAIGPSYLIALSIDLQSTAHAVSLARHSAHHITQQHTNSTCVMEFSADFRALLANDFRFRESRYNSGPWSQSMKFWIVSTLVSLAAATSAFAQSTVCTYQGELKQGSNLANGTYDLRFRLFDAASGGAQIGSTNCVNNVQVTDGKFVATFDFGLSFVTASSRFLDIEVRSDTGLDCSNAGGFVVLAPRQQLTATPLAAHSKSAFSLAAADGSPTNAVNVDNDGKVGIGTTTPTHTVHIASTQPTLALQDTDSTLQQVGYISYRDSLNTERGWIGYGTIGDPDLSIVNARTNGDIIVNSISGNVGILASGLGIGTVAPLSKLEVRGDIRMGTAGTQFATRGEENLRIIRGIVYTGTGSISAGSGFTVTPLSEGKCRINFNTPFSDFPTSVANTENSGSTTASKFVEVVGLFTTSSTFQVIQRSSGDHVDGTIEFIIIGPR